MMMISYIDSMASSLVYGLRVLLYCTSTRMVFIDSPRDTRTSAVRVHVHLIETTQLQ